MLPPEVQAPKPVVAALHTAARPVVFTRQSNDYITNLLHLAANQPIPGSLPQTPDPEPQLENGQQDLFPVTSAPRQQSVMKMTALNPARNRWRIIGGCMWGLCNGVSDAAPGVLLPTIESKYDILYSVVSLIWMLNAAGYILVAIFAHKVQGWFGKAKLVPVGCFLSTLMHLMVLSGGPFPLIVTGFFFGGLGSAVVLSQLNIFFSKLEKNSKYLAFFHGLYGIGATVSPFLATTMVNHGVRWNYVYLFMLGLLLTNAITTFIAFKGADEDLKPWDNEEPERLLELEETTGGMGISGTFETPANKSEMALALRNVLTWNLSFFLLFYQGTEVALGGWIVLYLIDYRRTSTSYGYVSSGFWGGLTLGRLLLTRPLHKFLGVRRTLNLFISVTIVTIGLTWAVKSNILLSVFVSLCGVLIGPVYPLMITGVVGLLPRKIQVVSLTITSAFGSSGGALVPFMVGLAAQGTGTFVVLPICIGTYFLVLILWLLLPYSDRKGPPPQTFAKKVVDRLW